VTSGDDQRVDAAQRLVYRAMENLMQLKGLRTARALAQLLNQHGYTVSERTVTAWRGRESAIPAWALVAFGDISDTSVDALLEQGGLKEVSTTLARHEAILGELQSTLAAVRERVDQGDLVDSDVRQRLAGLEKRITAFMDIVGRLQQSVEVHGELLQKLVPTGTSESKRSRPSAAELEHERANQ
jgi:hypothetical protein